MAAVRVRTGRVTGAVAVIWEREPMPDLDHDCEPLRAALARLAGLLCGQLSEVSCDLHQRARLTPWEACKVAEQLEHARKQIEYLRKEVARCVPKPEVE